MPRFNFNNITLASSADISKVAENFDKIEQNAVLTTDTATTSTAGLMSAADKTKLNGIATGANKTTVDSSLSSSSTNPVQNKVINTALGNKVSKEDGKGLSTNDYSTEEKTKLAGIEAQANKIIVDAALDDESTNPVQNAIIAARFNALANVADSGSYNDLSNIPIYNAGSISIANGSSAVGDLTAGRLYKISGLTVNNTSDTVFANGIIRYYISVNNIPFIALLMSVNMNISGYIYYAYSYTNNAWHLESYTYTNGVVTGTFTRSTDWQTVSLGFTPRCVIVDSGVEYIGGYGPRAITKMVTTSNPTYVTVDSSTPAQQYSMLEIVTNGFKHRISSNDYEHAETGTGYRYIAFK